MVVRRFDLAKQSAQSSGGTSSSGQSVRARRAQKSWKPIVIARPDNHPYHCLCTQVAMGLSELCPAHMLAQYLHYPSH